MEETNAHDIPLPLSPLLDAPSVFLHSYDTSAIVDSQVNNERVHQGEPEPPDEFREREIKDPTSGVGEEEKEGEEEKGIRERTRIANSRSVSASRPEPLDQPVYQLQVNDGIPKSANETQEISSNAPTPPSKMELSPETSQDAIPQSRPSVERLPPQATNGHYEGPPLTLNPKSPLTGTHKRSLTISKGHTVSVVLISSALETIAASKEAKRSTPLRESTNKALEMIRSNQGGDRPREIFEPLRLACETRNEKLMIASLDCISKLISYSFFAEPDDNYSHSMHSPPTSPHPHGPPSTIDGSQSTISQPSLVDLVAHTITSCHTETTPETVSLQIVKALLSLVLSPTILVHHSSLLKAVRTVYNVFLLSADPVNQMVAQGGLTQMVHHVFTRCRTRGTSIDPTFPTLSGHGSASPSARASFTIPTLETDVKTFDNGHSQGELASEHQDPTTVSDEGETHGNQEVIEPQPRITLYVMFVLW